MSNILNSTINQNFSNHHDKTVAVDNSITNEKNQPFKASSPSDNQLENHNTSHPIASISPSSTSSTCNNQNNNGMDYESVISPENSKFECYKPTNTSFYHRVIVNDWVNHFSLAYFVSVMGTGISSNLLYNFPWPSHWMIICSYIMFAITCILFIINVILFTLSIIHFSHRMSIYHLDPTQATFMGCFSMGYTTIVNYINILCKGNHMYFVWTLWWIAVFGAIYTSFVVVFFAFFSKLNQVQTNPKLNATLLLPIVAITVLSSSGHQIELNLYHTNHVIITMIVSFMLWCLSISLAMMIMTIYIHRLIVHKIPPTNLIFTSFLPVGFLGQSSYSIYLFGNNLNKFIPEDLLYGKILLCICGFFAVFLLSLGYFMTFLAVMSILSKIKPFARNLNMKHTNQFGLLKHNKNFWAMTFPLGTMSLSNTEIGLGGVGNYPLLTFKVMGAIFATCCILITSSCVIGVVIYNVRKVKSAFARKSGIESSSSTASSSIV